jgi:hypothetical protein
MVAPARRKLQVFLSHSARDQELARRIGDLLRVSGFEVWPLEKLPPGENWALKSGIALESSDAMVVIVSPDAATSEHVQREIDYALVTERFTDRLIPVIAKPTRRMPWILGELATINAEKDPVAASEAVVQRLRQLSTSRSKAWRGGDRGSKSSCRIQLALR